MRVVVAGASGLIGHRLTALLLKNHHTVVLLTTSRVTGNNAVLWDGKSQGDWAKEINGADAVVNLSGQSLGSGRWTETRKRILVESRLKSTRALVEAIRSSSQQPGTLVNASAVGFYGHVGSDEVTEERPAGTGFLAQLCAQWEEEALRAASHGVRVLLLRSGVVLDPEGGALQRFITPFRFWVGGPLGRGTQWFPWIHCEDEVKAILFALEHSELAGPLNLAAPGAATMVDFTRALGAAMRRPAIFKVPAVALRIMLGEMAEMVLSGQRVVPAKLLKAGFEFRFPKLEGALADIVG